MILQDKFTTNRTYQLLVHWVEDAEFASWYYYVKERNHMSENALFEPVDFVMWMLSALLSGTKLIPEWKSIGHLH